MEYGLGIKEIRKYGKGAFCHSQFPIFPISQTIFQYPYFPIFLIISRGVVK